MSRPFSRSQLERLGRRLASAETPELTDLRDLQILLSAYTPVLTQTVVVVQNVTGQVPASRIKNTATIIEKLRRQGGHSLGTIHDLAGIRVVVSGGRDNQDEVVSALAAAFATDSRPPRLLDRRTNPVHGYRAVHVIVYPDGFPIEIQVRTRAQHRWAEWFERLADQYGRGIRYGEPLQGDNTVAQVTVDQMLRMADEIAAAEVSGSELPTSMLTLELVNQAIEWFRTRPRSS